MTVARRTPKYELKRGAVLDAAAALFDARGLADVTLADVARRVGLTTTSVTYYYRRKEDLAAACLLRVIAVMDALVTDAWTEAGATARLRRFLSLYFGLLADIAQGRAPPGINFWDLRGLTGPQAQAARNAFIAMFRRLRELFAGPDGPRLTRTEQNARGHLVLSAVIRSKSWVTRYEAEDYPRAASRMADVLIGGLAAAEGRAWPPPRLDFGVAAPGDAAPREAFFRAATQLINEHGYRGASVDRISARLNVTKGSFYHHNETKEGLVDACFERTFDAHRSAHRLAIDAASDGWSRIGAVADLLVRHQLSAAGPLLRLSALADTEGRAAWLAAFERLVEKTAGLVSDGIADGSLRAVDATIAAEVVMGAINAANELDRWAPAVTVDTATSLFVRPLLEGVFSPSSTG